MADLAFTVEKGLKIGPTTIDALTGDVYTTGNIVVVAPGSITGGTGGGGVSDAGELTGNVLSANVTASSLTSVGTLSSLAVAGAITTNSVEVGTKIVSLNTQSQNYITVLTDSGKSIFHPSADTSARTYTIPANSSVAYPLGTALMFINQNGAGAISIAITTDTMRLAGTGSTGTRTLAANGIATAIKIAATEWIISGTGLT